MTASTAPTTDARTATDPTTAHLTRADRCDRCGAQAFVRASLPGSTGSELLFCGHHSRAFELGLVAAGATIHDERHRIDEQAAAPEA